mmetsp:Transcript_9598/g.29584  ORF Transcript_9598/g.29584 Transcript_9598/m.29584 type:complete len:203 (-) Transcript_9598:1238-1846(-)
MPKEVIWTKPSMNYSHLHMTRRRSAVNERSESFAAVAMLRRIFWLRANWVDSPRKTMQQRNETISASWKPIVAVRLNLHRQQHHPSVTRRIRGVLDHPLAPPLHLAPPPPQRPRHAHLPSLWIRNQSAFRTKWMHWPKNWNGSALANANCRARQIVCRARSCFVNRQMPREPSRCASVPSTNGNYSTTRSAAWSVNVQRWSG